MDDIYGLFQRTRRAEVNWGSWTSFLRMREALVEAVALITTLKDYNFDAREVSREEAVKLLEKTIYLTKMTKERFLKVRRELDQLIFNLDWYLQRCTQDMKRYKCEQ